MQGQFPLGVDGAVDDPIRPGPLVEGGDGLLGLRHENRGLPCGLVGAPGRVGGVHGLFLLGPVNPPVVDEPVDGCGVPVAQVERGRLLP